MASNLERPVSLVIALPGLDSASRGTLRTAIRQVSQPVLCRREGAIVALDDRSPRWIAQEPHHDSHQYFQNVARVEHMSEVRPKGARLR